MQKLILGFLLAISTSVGAVGVIENTKVAQLGYDKGQPNLVFIRTEVPPGQPDNVDCNTNPGWNYVLNISSSFEEKIYSALLAAHASKQAITLRGSGNCASHAGIEDLHVLYTF